MAELVEAENFADASILYEEQRSFFDEKASDDPELAGHLKSVVAAEQASITPGLEEARRVVEAIDWPAPRAEWPKVRDTLSKARDALGAVPKDGVFVNADHVPESAAELDAAINRARAKIAATVERDFSDFDHFSGTNFFSVHPTTADPRAFFEAHPAALTSVLSGASADDIDAFAASLGRDSVSEAQWMALGNAYAQARFSDLPDDQRNLRALLAIFDDAKSKGFQLQTLDAFNIGFVEVTSRTLLDQGQVEYPAAVEVDLPVAVSKGELEHAFDADAVRNADYLIVFDVALAKARRKVGRMQKQRSEAIVGYRQEPNPEYARLQNALNAAQIESQNASMNVAVQQSQYCYGLACIGKIVGVAAAAAERDEAQQKAQSLMSQLNATSLTIDVPVKQPYNYEVAHIDASKTMTVHYYVIDVRRKRYFKSTFDVVENEKFAVAYRVAETDPNRSDNIAKHNTEQDVSDWEKKPSSVKLSQLVEHYLLNEGKAIRLADLDTLRREMLKDRNTTLASYKANTFDESTANDPRFDSVVAIYMPDGRLGTGFFVRPDIVMTNYHVVEEGEFAEMKMHDEQETFGKVIARDAGVDLALIKVQSRGKPVRFYDRNRIELGSTVEVIGHPRGYEFSITRGVVSAIRKEKSPNLGGGADVLHVQVDAATSPGNSGGPVFYKDYVVSVVSWGRNDRGSENLNFTIHHSEAERFLAESLASGS